MPNDPPTAVHLPEVTKIYIMRLVRVLIEMPPCLLPPRRHPRRLFVPVFPCAWLNNITIAVQCFMST